MSNVGTIQVRCQVSGHAQSGNLSVTTTAYEISAKGSKTLVPSEVKPFGGGFGPDFQPAWTDFYVHIPLDSDELDSEIRGYVAKLEGSLPRHENRQFTEETRQKMLKNLRKLVYQHRVGHFQINCQISDGTGILGSDTIELEVLFKGRFSEIGLSVAPPA